MSNFVIDTSEVVFEDKSGRVLVEGSLLDIHYMMSDVSKKIRDIKSDANNQDIYSEVAIKLMELQDDKNKVPISWGAAAKIAIEISKQVEEVKKN